MIRLTRAHLQPIGLDLGHDTVKMIQLEQVGDSLSVAVAAKAVLPPEARVPSRQRSDALADVIRQLLRKHPFTGRSVVTALPREVVHVRSVRLPQAVAADLPQLVQYEARNVLPFDAADAQVAFLPAGEIRQPGGEVRQEVIIIAARNSDIADFLELIHRSGATVESLDIEAAALYRTVDRFVRRREDELDVHVLVDVGAARSQVVIGRGREIHFIKAIEIGGRHFNEAVARKLGITYDEAQALRRRLREPAEGAALASTAAANPAKRDPVRQAAGDACRSEIEELGREVALCLRYHSVTFRGQRPTKLRLLGGEAGDPQLQSLLTAALTIPVEVGRPLYSVDSSRMNPLERRGAMSEWAIAFGLSLKGVIGTFGPRDGRPRDRAVGTEVSSSPTAVAEVVDVAAAVRAAEAAAASETKTETRADGAAHAAAVAAAPVVYSPSEPSTLPRVPEPPQQERARWSSGPELSGAPPAPSSTMTSTTTEAAHA